MPKIRAAGLPLPEEACVEAYQPLLERPTGAPAGAKIGVFRDTYPNALMKA